MRLDGGIRVPTFMNRDKGGPGGGHLKLGVHLVSVSVCTNVNGY